jgi:hypothetical protein
MNRVHVKLLMMAAAGSLLFSNSITAQNSAYTPEILPPAPKAASVKITEGPRLELARTNWAIIRWRTSNPGGTDQHFGIVHYGTNPNELSQTAKSPIRVNRYHSDTMFRVRVLDLSPQTTYYYTVDSVGSTGESDGVKSSVNKFSTR